MRNLALTLSLAAGVAASPAPHAPPAEVITLPTPSPVRFFNLARTGGLAAVVCRDHQLRVWALPQGRPLSTIDLGDLAFGCYPQHHRCSLGSHRSGQLVARRS